MCLALYLASDGPLPIIERRSISKDAVDSPTWPREAQRFHTAALLERQKAVLSKFSHGHVLSAGSYEGCGCGFNYGREYPDHETKEHELVAARESVAELVRYVHELKVKQIYSCWCDDEAHPTLSQRTVNAAELAGADFVFQQQELLTIDHRE